MDLQDAETLALATMARHGLLKHGYKFKWDSHKNRFGACHNGKKLIYLSTRLTLLNNEEKVKDTILHEIAHALDYIRHGVRHCGRKRLVHDQVWKSICLEIGCKPERCYSEKDGYVTPQKSPHKYMLIHVPTGKVLRLYRNKTTRYDNSLVRVNGIVGKVHLQPINSGLE